MECKLITLAHSFKSNKNLHRVDVFMTRSASETCTKTYRISSTQHFVNIHSSHQSHIKYKHEIYTKKFHKDFLTFYTVHPAETKFPKQYHLAVALQQNL